MGPSCSNMTTSAMDDMDEGLGLEEIDCPVSSDLKTFWMIRAKMVCLLAQHHYLTSQMGS